MGKIVVCEDDRAIQTLIRVALRATGHEVHLADDGVEGLALIERERPDAIFTDVAMPGMTGLQLAAAVKARPHLAHIPIVLLTASVQRTQIEAGYRHGAVAYLAKPFSPAVLRDKVDAIIAAERDR